MRKALAVGLSVLAVLVVGTAATGSVQTLITGTDIKDQSIGSNDIRPGAIQSHDIKNGTITQIDLSKILLTTLQGATGTQGAKGDTGATGAQGAKGDTGKTGAQGAKGDAGSTGPAGPAGPKGAKGDRGSSGLSDLEADGPYPGRSDPENNLHGNQGAQSTLMWMHGQSTVLQESWVMCAPGKVALGGGFGQDDVQTDLLVIVTSTPVNITQDGVKYPAGTPTDEVGSLLAPNGWLVQGYNKSELDLIVRPWVICAKVSDAPTHH
jgi:hypothetical protein